MRSELICGPGKSRDPLFNSPSGFLIAVILGVMMKIRHPTPWDVSPLDTKRKVIAFVTLVIFVLCFVPFPIRIS